MLDLVACVLQLSGTVALSQSMYVFHVILPLILCFLTAYIILEGGIAGARSACGINCDIWLMLSRNVIVSIKRHTEYVTKRR